MLLAVISDIHANRHAFEAVLAAIDGTAAEEIICLGDLVGYGGEPDRCVTLTRERCSYSLVGNHDLAIVGSMPISAFSSSAGVAARWTAKTVTDETKTFLSSLAPSGERHDLGLFHGSPRNPVWEYVLSPEVADHCMDDAVHRITLVGHSHSALSFNRSPDSPIFGKARAHGEQVDVSSGEWILNPGSVGQPRDRDPRAAWMLLDTEQSTATWQRTEYDIDGAAAAIRLAGLPDVLAKRLYVGR